MTDNPDPKDVDPPQPMPKLIDSKLFEGLDLRDHAATEKFVASLRDELPDRGFVQNQTATVGVNQAGRLSQVLKDISVAIDRRMTELRDAGDAEGPEADFLETVQQQIAKAPL